MTYYVNRPRNIIEEWWAGCERAQEWEDSPERSPNHEWIDFTPKYLPRGDFLEPGKFANRPAGINFGKLFDTHLPTDITPPFVTDMIYKSPRFFWTDCGDPKCRTEAHQDAFRIRYCLHCGRPHLTIIECKVRGTPIALRYAEDQARRSVAIISYFLYRSGVVSHPREVRARCITVVGALRCKIPGITQFSSFKDALYQQPYASATDPSFSINQLYPGKISLSTMESWDGKQPSWLAPRYQGVYYPEDSGDYTWKGTCCNA